MTGTGSRDQLGRSLVTRTSLAADLGRLGVQHGDTVCAHVAMGRLGYVCGAAQTVIGALADAVGETGTVMMPAFSGELSDPATWKVPPVPSDWIEVIRAETPPFDPIRTPTRQMGVVAELFRLMPGTQRSPHPHSSFAAAGARADTLTTDHPLSYRFGPRSPLGKLAALDGYVVMLGAGVDRASVVYLAQFLSGIGGTLVKSVPMWVNGKAQWVDYEDIALDNRLVSSGVTHLIESGIAATSEIGDCRAVRIPVRDALAALMKWRWRDTDLPVEPARPPQPLPTDWSQWL